MSSVDTVVPDSYNRNDSHATSLAPIEAEIVSTTTYILGVGAAEMWALAEDLNVSDHRDSNDPHQTIYSLQL